MRKAGHILFATKLIIMILAFCCCLSGKSMAQSSVLETRITVHYTDKPLFVILQEISRNYQISFSYFKNQLPLQKKITIRSQNIPLQEVLDHIQTQAGIQYQAVGGQIVLKESNRANSGNQPAIHQHPADKWREVSKQTSIEKKDFLFLTNTSTYNPGVKNTDKNVLSNRLTEHKRKRKRTKGFSSIVPKTANTHEAKQTLNKINVAFQGTSVAQLTNPYKIHSPEIAQLPESILLQVVPQIPAEKPVYSSSTIQLALLPGLSTHGIHPGEYTNGISLNLLAGYSAGNQIVEIGGLSNFNQNHVFGLQIGGIANVVGGNKFAGLSPQEKQKLKKEKPEANIQGVQVAGLTNIIGGNVFGWQTTGGINIVQKSLQGVQVAGASNLVNTYSFGIQVAGISNAAMESVDGVQVAGLYNYTEGELHGIQLSAFNQAGEIEGKRSLISVHHTGLQIGLVNTARRMNGFQIGLVNVGGDMAGTQIGLINLNKSKKGNGMPIGLLNLNTKNHFIRLYSSELFASNLEVSTGSLRIQNILSLGYNPVKGVDFYRPAWSVGYSIGQIKRPGTFFYSYDAGVAHINQSGKLNRQLSLLTRARAIAGYKVELRKVVFNIFGGITFNAFFADRERTPVSPDLLRIYHKNTSRSHTEIWPGFVAGIHL